MCADVLLSNYSLTHLKNVSYGFQSLAVHWTAKLRAANTAATVWTESDHRPRIIIIWNVTSEHLYTDSSGKAAILAPMIWVGHHLSASTLVAFHKQQSYSQRAIALITTDVKTSMLEAEGRDYAADTLNGSGLFGDSGTGVVSLSISSSSGLVIQYTNFRWNIYRSGVFQFMVFQLCWVGRAGFQVPKWQKPIRNDQEGYNNWLKVCCNNYSPHLAHSQSSFKMLFLLPSSFLLLRPTVWNDSAYSTTVHINQPIALVTWVTSRAYDWLCINRTPVPTDWL
jgi:hypothetical protein